MANDRRPSRLKRLRQGWLRFEESLETSITPWVVIIAVTAVGSLLWFLVDWLVDPTTARYR